MCGHVKPYSKFVLNNAIGVAYDTTIGTNHLL
ncbi:hypothetical protein CLMAG_27290 [Clostridium magnum DSM 2767]|uniref:Uncharacterized protein n=1 Tax=Clostridium magnum DSM 2767 TaxID=1121326 RepID=A0A162TQA9_9CLOT|nr:hypothetical protein CLMAG_27290 [Clostridium magnum DSM 2767]